MTVILCFLHTVPYMGMRGCLICACFGGYNKPRCLLVPVIKEIIISTDNSVMFVCVRVCVCVCVRAPKKREVKDRICGRLV